MEFCISCGSIIPDDADFCPNCGAAGTKYRLEHEEAAAEESTAAEAETAVEESAEVCAEASAEEIVSEQPAEAPVPAEAEPVAEAAPQEECLVVPSAESSAEQRYAAALLGSAQTRRAEPEQKEKAEGKNSLAVTGFVFSLLPIPFIISGIVGLILSSIAHKRAKQKRYANDLDELAIAGKVLSIVRIAVIAFAALAGVAISMLMAYLDKNGLQINLRNLWQ